MPAVSGPVLGMTQSVESRMEAIGRSGCTISICCGPCGARPFSWSVQVLSPTGHEFDRPFTAHSFEHAVEIAELEIQKRGWA